MNTTTGNQTSTLPTLDYPTFRQAGIDQLQTWVGRDWTDFNEHDPGITLLENFCYALTDLTYRLGYSVPDLLCQGDRNPYASLYTPAQILTTQPVTLLDLRKLVVDVRGVGNAWIIKVADPSPTVYYHTGTLPDLPSDSEKFILLDSSQGGQTLNPSGLYQVLIAKSQTLDLLSKQIVGPVAARLHAHRQLGMDFDSVQVMDTQYIQVKATIEISSDGDANSIYLAILQALANYIAPPLHFYTWQERLAAGKRIDEIFDGPILSQGFIDNDELQGMQQKSALRVSDCIQTIMDVEGVVMVKYIALNNGGLDWQNWSLDLDVTQSPILDFMGSTLSLERKELAVTLDRTSINNSYSLAQQGLGYQLASPGDLDVMTAPGRDRHVDRYYSVQHQLPLVYGVGSFGLPPQADAQRCAQAKQLKAYMLHFEQLLADEFGQLSHLGDVLGFDGDDPRTYFSVAIDDPSLGLDSLWQQDAAARQQRLQQIVENPATASDDPTQQVDWQRRNRLLDHLLARFAEQYYDYAQFEPAPPDVDSPLPRLAALKRAWLLSYPELSRGRGTGRDISKPTDAANLAGLVKNLALKLGVSINTDSVSKTESVSSMATAAYPPLPQDTDAVPYLVEHSLLRPIDADGAQGGPLLANARRPDPYSLQISLVFPGDSPRYQSSVFRSFVEKTVSEESPAHLSVYLVWLNQADMHDFRAAYGVWLSFLSQYRQRSNDLGPHPDNVDHAISFPLRDARDRLIDLLGIGQTYPLADLALAGNQTIACNETCQIPLPFSQQGVIYALCDKTDTPLVSAIQVTGNGIGGDNSLYLETPPITEDITYTIRATKPSGLSLMLNQRVDVKMGFDTSLIACIVVVSPNTQLLDPSDPGPTAARIVNYGASVQVQVQASQQGVAYTLQDASGKPLMIGSVTGDLSSILLTTTKPVLEDLSIRILATKTFELTGNPSTEKALLVSVLPLMVRANPALAVTVPQPLVQYQQPTSIVVANTQASVTYQLWSRDILDKEYRHVGNADWGQALPVTNCSYARIPRPSSLKAGLTATGLSQTSNGGSLDLNTADLVSDTLLVVQATKSHKTQAGKTFTSTVQLNQPAIALVYPNDNPSLGLAAIPTKAGYYHVLNGQPGVFYAFSVGGTQLGSPVYIHKRDETDPTQNMGVSQLVMEVDFAIPPDHPANLQPPPNLAELPPETPEWDSGTTLSSDATLTVSATKAQTGLETQFTLTLQQAIANVQPTT